VFNVLLIILFSSILLYIINTIVIYIGTFQLNYLTTQNLQKVSVLVALRNEAKTLESCVKSLINLDYPEHLIEFILINDRSTDATPEIIDDLKKRSPNIKTIHINHSIRNLSGKANAIAQGIQHASGEIMLVTDGDCVVPASWAKTHVSYYTKDVGIVSGFTLLNDKNDKTSLFGKIQSLDWAYLLSIGSGAIGFGKPLSVIGNNFSFRKAAYDVVGGYQKMGFTIIEDFTLMKSLLKHTHWQVRYPINSKMLSRRQRSRTIR